MYCQCDYLTVTACLLIWLSGAVCHHLLSQIALISLIFVCESLSILTCLNLHLIVVVLIESQSVLKGVNLDLIDLEVLLLLSCKRNVEQFKMSECFRIKSA